jgi:uncharacterized UPF0160 family protein
MFNGSCLPLLFLLTISFLSYLRSSLGWQVSRSSSALMLESAVSSKRIGTHSGTFQADEAMGCWMLRQLPEYRNSKVVRSRYMDILNDLDIVIDVGGVYDHSRKRYDHHQRGYDERFDPKDGTERCTKLSASGLIYRHYGKDVIKTFYPEISDSDLDLAYVKVYDSLLEALDAIDTGVEMFPDGVEPLYTDTTGLSRRVSRLNPRWNEVNDKGQQPDPDERFEIACKTCGDDFLSVMISVVESDIPARAFVERALLNRYETDASGEIIVLESGGLPWRGHLYKLEKEHKVESLVKFVLYTDTAGMWRVQAVTVEGKGFENRLSLPEAWRGVRDEGKPPSVLFQNEMPHLRYMSFFPSQSYLKLLESLVRSSVMQQASLEVAKLSNVFWRWPA